MNHALLSPTLDPVSTRPRSPSMNPKNSTFPQSVVPTHTLKDAPDIDVLLVPGGRGTRAPDLNTTIKYIAATYPQLQYLITICSGAGLAAQAGVLDGKRATINKASWSGTVALGPRVKWISRARWTVDGNIWTSSGISAGIDATLAFIEYVYGGTVATRIANSIGVASGSNVGSIRLHLQRHSAMVVQRALHKSRQDMELLLYKNLSLPRLYIIKQARHPHHPFSLLWLTPPTSCRQV